MIGRFPVGPTSLQQVLSGEIWGTTSVAETTSGFVDVWEREFESQHVKRRPGATGKHSCIFRIFLERILVHHRASIVEIDQKRCENSIERMFCTATLRVFPTLHVRFNSNDY